MADQKVTTIKREDHNVACQMVSVEKIVGPAPKAPKVAIDSDDEVTFVKAERVRKPTASERTLRTVEEDEQSKPAVVEPTDDPLEVEKNFPCPQCKKIFSTGGHLVAHLQHHNKGRRRKPLPTEFNCIYCHMTFDRQVSYAAHMHVHKDMKQDKLLECSECDMRFTSKGSLWHHRKMTHIEVIHKCPMCSRTFAKQNMFERHLAQHKDVGEISCDHCESKFNSKHTLKVHMKTHTNERPFLCSTCGKSFRTNQRLQEHVRRHKGITSHTCHICGKAFYEKNELKKHSYSHTIDKPHVCDICGRGFILPNRLREHTRTHTGEKPYKCDYTEECGKCFTNLSQLKRHILGAHKGEKPFKCEICHRAFLDKGCLKTHTERLHGDKSLLILMCPIVGCGTEFKSNRKLNQHLIEHNVV